MCRDLSCGGRRCPSSRGERKRAYQRARYAAVKTVTRRTPTVSPPTDPGADTGAAATSTAAVADYRSVDVTAMTVAQRAEFAEQARARVPEARKAVHKAWTDLESVAPDDPRREKLESDYTAAVREAGSHIAAAYDAERATALEQAGVSESPEAADAAMREELGKTKYPEYLLMRWDMVTAVRSNDNEALERLRKEMGELLPGQRPPNAKAADKEVTKAATAAANRKGDVTRAALREELSRHTDLADRMPAEGTTYTKAVTKASRKTLDECVSFFPRAAVEDAWTKGNALTVKKTTARAHYAPMSFHEGVRDGYVSVSPSVSKVRGMGVVEGLEMDIERMEADPGHRPVASVTLIDPETTASLRSSSEDETVNRHLDRLMCKDSPHARKVMDKYVDLYNSRPHVGSDFVVREMQDSSGDTYLTVARRATMRGKVIVGSGAALTTDGSVQTSVHELAHRVEDKNPKIGIACKRFVAERTEGLSYTRRKGYGRGELQCEDSFVEPYVSKRYKNTANSSEVFSMGMEALVGGRFGGLIGEGSMTSGGSVETHREDREHRDLVLGLLATAGSRDTTA